MNKEKPILIVAAMDAEVNYFLEKIEEIKENNLDGYTVWEGKIEGYPVLLLRTKVGTINAAVSTYATIKKYAPICVINEGTSGGHGTEVRKGDIVIGKECINILSYQSENKKIGEGTNPLTWDMLTFISGEKNRQVVYEADERLVHVAEETKSEYKIGKVWTGRIGSGDVWNREADRILDIHKRCKTLCEEMEGISIYTVCNNLKVPVIGIRIISNNEILEETYERNLGEECQKFVYKVVKKYIKELGK